MRRLINSFKQKLFHLLTQINCKFLQVCNIAIRASSKVLRTLGCRSDCYLSSAENNFLVYLNIYPNDKWVLNSIFDKTIAEYDKISRIESIKLTRLKDLVFLSANNPDKVLFLFTHYKELIQGINSIGLKNVKIITYFTHSTFLQSKTIDILNTCHAVLCMNSIEAARLASLGIKSAKLRVLPGGTTRSECISIIESSKEPKKDIDIIFGMKYTKKLSYDRKNYAMITDLIYDLCNDGNIVCVSGPGWFEFFQQSKRLIDSSNLIIDPNTNRRDTLEFYKRSKIFINFSLLEGGPMPLLDAFICSCICLSTPTGFVFDLFRNNQKRLYIIGLRDTVQHLSATIQSILDSKPIYSPLNLREIPKEFFYESISDLLLDIVGNHKK